MPQQNGAAPAGAADSDDLDARAILQRVNFLLKRAERAIAEMAEILGELLVIGEKRKRSKKELDDNGEPTWRYKVKRKIPDDIYLTARFREYALNQSKRCSSTDVEALFASFCDWYRRNGTKWLDWSLVWFKWCREERKRRAASGGAPTEARTSRSFPEMR